METMSTAGALVRYIASPPLPNFTISIMGKDIPQNSNIPPGALVVMPGGYLFSYRPYRVRPVEHYSLYQNLIAGSLGNAVDMSVSASLYPCM